MRWILGLDLDARSRGALELASWLRAASEALEATLRDKARETEVLKARIREMEQENEVLRTVKEAPLADDRAGTKEKIDELVNEIDQCLALLNT